MKWARTSSEAEPALAAARRFREWLDQRFGPTRMLVEHPIAHRLTNNQIVRGWADLLLETDHGWIIIDHKSSPRPRSEWRNGLASKMVGALRRGNPRHRRALLAAISRVRSHVWREGRTRSIRGHQTASLDGEAPKRLLRGFFRGCPPDRADERRRTAIPMQTIGASRSRVGGRSR